MKKLILFIILLGIVFVSKGQKLEQLKGVLFTTTEANRAAVGLRSNAQVQLDAKVDTASVIDLNIDSIVAFKVDSTIRSIFYELMGIDSAKMLSNNFILYTGEKVDTIHIDGTSGKGAELVTDGIFTSSAAWTIINSNATISGGKANFNTVANYDGVISQVIDVVNGTTYQIKFDISDYVSGSFKVGFGDLTQGSFGALEYSADGSYTLNLQLNNALAPLQLFFLSWNSGAVLKIDNVSVKEIL